MSIITLAFLMTVAYGRQPPQAARLSRSEVAFLIVFYLLLAAFLASMSGG